MPFCLLNTTICADSEEALEKHEQYMCVCLRALTAAAAAAASHFASDDA